MRVILLAPTHRQIVEVTWREVCRFWNVAKSRGHDLDGEVYEQPDRGIRGPNGKQIFGFSTTDPDKFSGISGPVLIFIVDEAAGVDDRIFEAILGNAAGGAWIILLGNPTRTEGQFYRAFHEESDQWKTFHISSERTPTARGVRAIPGLSTKEWIEERRKAWHPYESHPLYAVRVRGDFPLQGATSVVSAAVLERAIGHWQPAPPTPDARLDVGLDCARFGDDRNALATIRGQWMGEIVTWGDMDGPQVAGRAIAEIKKRMTQRERSGHAPPPRVKVDVIGIGASVYDALKASASDWEILPVNVGSAAHSSGTKEEPEYTNLRAQVHFAVAEWLEQGGELPDDPELKSELLAAQYGFDVRGRIKVESKDEIKKRLGRSPDKADAVALAVYNPPTFVPQLLNIPNL